MTRTNNGSSVAKSIDIGEYCVVLGVNDTEFRSVEVDYSCTRWWYGTLCFFRYCKLGHVLSN
jgi:hypothetical protein